MRSVPLLSLLLASCLCVLGCRISGPVTTRDGGGEDGSVSAADADGDGIADEHEAAAESRDSDEDGTPDFEDQDSDDDGIPDSIEAGDTELSTRPRDSDSDGDADFVDEDSDGNGILDAQEADGDIDEDLTPNFADTDDDGDFVRDVDEIRGAPASPPDFDTDGRADFQDNDSDNDTISDGQEREADTDNDGMLDANDLDSDRDGIIDANEAGDADTRTPPVDTDMDLVPDFRDPDSDDDGLADGDEQFIHNTLPNDRDSDDDGISDLIEVSAGTDPRNNADSPRTRGDFVFEVPYMMPPSPLRDTLTFRTSIQFADVYFMFDRSGSMGDEISALQGAVATTLNDLTCADTGAACVADSDCGGGNICNPFSRTCTEDPGTTNCVPSIYSGAGWYVDSNTLANTLSLQGDPMRTRTVGLAFSACSACSDERLYSAIQAVAEPATVTGESGCTGPAAGVIGCPAFRSEAVRILVAFTDEDSDGGTLATAASALMRQGITMIGVWSGATTSTSRAALVNVARDSGSLDSRGMPLVFNGSGAGVVPALTSAINEIVEGVPLRVTIEATDEPEDAGDALQFLAPPGRLETNTDVADGCSAVATEDVDGDGVHETFPEVTPGTPVCWDVVPRQNDTVMPERTPLVFRARLTVYGDGSPLDSRLVYFLVPPEIPDPGGPD